MVNMLRRSGLILSIVLLCAALILGACSGGPTGSDRGDTGEEPTTGDQSPPVENNQHDGTDEPGGGGSIDAEFSLHDIQVGDTVAGMTVQSIGSPVPGDGNAAPVRDPDNVSIAFSGQATITARYTYYPPEDDFLANAVCMHVGDGVAAGLPHMVEDQRYTWFCFHNEDEARAVFKEPSAGVASVTIDDYTIISYPSEVWNTATLVEAEAIDGRPLVKEITTYPEGMEEKGLFRLTDIFWVPVITYIPDTWQMQALELENAAGMLLLPGVDMDVGWVEIVVFDDGVSREEVEGTVRERLEQEGFSSIQEAQVPQWALAHYAAEDNSAKDSGEWRRAHAYVGRHGDRHFFVVDQLNLLEAGDGWGPIIQVIFDEWRWADTGQPLAG